MSEYLKSLDPNDAQCYIKKLTLTTRESLPDPYTLVAEGWEGIINKFSDITWEYHGISYRNDKFLHKEVSSAMFLS